MAIDFLLSNAAFDKSSISTITLPAPASASDGWAVGLWCRLKSTLSDTADRNIINHILQLSPTNEAAWNVANTLNLWWATNSNNSSIDGIETVTGKFYAAVSDWVSGNNSNAGNWSDVTFPANDSDRLLVLQLVNVAGSWKLRLYVTVKGASATLVNESPVVTPVALPVSHLRFGDRIPSPGTRDWRDIAGQLFLIKRPLSLADITQLASGTSAITAIAAPADILGYWPAETPAAALTDASGSGNDLTTIGAAASYAGFDFLSAGPASLITANASHAHSAALANLGLAATTITRPSPHGDVDLALSTVSNASTLAPQVWLYGDAEANANIPNSWQNLCARIENVLGKTPSFVIANGHEWRNGGAANLGVPQRGWRPWWRATGSASTSWQRFDGYTVSGNAISFSNAAAFNVPSIEVAFFPVWNLDETSALFDAIYASSLGSEPSAAIVYRAARPGLPPGTHNETAAVTSPDGIVLAALPMRSARISDAATLSPEGLPKRKAILLFNIHAQEASGGWVADRLIRSLLGTSADAIYLRERFVVDCYAVNYTGMAGGCARGVVEGWSGSGDLPDPNRAWPAQLSPPNGPLPEVNDVAAAIHQDSGGKADVLISFHSDVLTSANYGLAYYNAAQDSLVAVKQFKDLLIAGSDGLTLSLTGDNMAPVAPGLYRDQGFGRSVLGASLSWIQEMSFATSDYLADSQFVANRQMSALRALATDGFLPVSISAAATSHGHMAQSINLALAGTLIPQRAAQAHTAQSVFFSSTGALLVQPALQAHVATTALFGTATGLFAASAVHGQSAQASVYNVSAAISALRSTHAHRASGAALSGPAVPTDMRRSRSIPGERRTLKLRFS